MYTNAYVLELYLHQTANYNCLRPYAKITPNPHVAHMCSHVSHMSCSNFTCLPTCEETFSHVKHISGHANTYVHRLSHM